MLARCGVSRQQNSEAKGATSSFEQGRNHLKRNDHPPSGFFPSFWKISTRVAFKNGQELPAGKKSGELLFFLRGSDAYL